MTPALELEGVALRRADAQILRAIDWTLRDGERWVVLGANGSGKTTLLRIAALYDHPSSGVVRVLGNELGRCDVRALRRRIGFVSAGFAELIRPQVTAADVVMCALNAALEPWWHTYTDDDRARAAAALDRIGVAHLAGHTFGSLSSGERQRVQLARSLMCDPGLLLLDEPTAGLDLLGREQVISDLERIGADGPPMALVTHHLEEIPSTFTHALVLAHGAVLASGAIDDVVTDGTISEAAGLDVTVERRDGRWAARGTR